MRTQCEVCKYRGVCFWVLKWYYMYLKDEKCKQGEKERAPRVKNATTGSSDEVAKV